MSLTNNMEDTGLVGDNLEIGVALYQAVGNIDAESHLNVAKMKEIADFFNNRPGGAWELKTAVNKKTNGDISNLDHLLTYVSLNKQRQEAANKLEELDKQLKMYA